jgi:hypothetical protein
MNMYLNGDRSWYSGPGSFAGWWALNNDIGNDYSQLASTRVQGATYVQASVNAALSTIPPRYGDVVNNFTNSATRYAAGLSQAVPLGLLSSSLRCRQYWPLSQMGELVIQLTTAPAPECLFAPGGTGTPTYQLSDIYLECDLISPHFMYQELLNKVTQMEDQHGLVIPVDTTIVTQGQQIPAGSQDSSIIVSRATNNLRKVLVANVPAAGLQNLQWPSVGSFPCEAFNQVQFRIGSLYFPAQPSNSLARAFWMSQNSFGEPVNDRGGVVNIMTYGNTTGAGGAGGSGVLGTVTNLTAASGPALAYSDSFVLAYDFDNYKGGERLDADGVSVLGQAGSQLQIQLRNTPVEPIQPIVSLVATKYIQLKDGTLSIKGV